MLEGLDYSLQSTRQTRDRKVEAITHAQFRYINRCVKVFQRAGISAISVDASTQELVGPFANKGREYQSFGTPEQVRTHD